jgi:hypothetical protein
MIRPICRGIRRDIYMRRSAGTVGATARHDSAAGLGTAGGRSTINSIAVLAWVKRDRPSDTQGGVADGNPQALIYHRVTA